MPMPASPGGNTLVTPLGRRLASPFNGRLKSVCAWRQHAAVSSAVSVDDCGPSGGGAKSDKTTRAKTQVNTTTASSGAAGIILNRVEAPRDVEEGSVWGGGVSIPIEVFGEQAAP